jgi:hypothetical protein
MNRRRFLSLFAGLAAALLAPLGLGRKRVVAQMTTGAMALNSTEVRLAQKRVDPPFVYGRGPVEFDALAEFRRAMGEAMMKKLDREMLQDAAKGGRG